VKRAVWLALAALALSCASKPAWWRAGQIAVVAEPLDWRGMRSELSMTFEHVVPTPEPEKTFDLVFVPERDFKKYAAFRFVIVAATLETKGRTGGIIRKLLSNRTLRQSVESGESFMFVERDQWAKGQLMLILVSRDLSVFRDRIRENRAFCTGVFESELVSESLRILSDRGEQTEASRRLLDRYGWTVRIPADCLVDESPADSLVWFFRGNPEHRLFVHWKTGGSPDPSQILRERDRLGALHFDRECVSEGFWESGPARFQQHPALRISGLWENEEKETGGPFVNYTFTDSASGRTYLIDGEVYSPGEKKLPTLRFLEAWMGSFRTKEPATVEPNAKGDKT
jgi:hypothetical protein